MLDNAYLGVGEDGENSGSGELHIDGVVVGSVEVDVLKSVVPGIQRWRSRTMKAMFFKVNG